MNCSKRYISGIIMVVFICAVMMFTLSCNHAPDEIEDYVETTPNKTDDYDEVTPDKANDKETDLVDAQTAEIIDPDTCIYVSLNGDDENGTGSIDKPYAMIEHAADMADAGDTIIVTEGVYTNQGEIKIEKENITIRSEQGKKAVICAPYDVEDICFCFWFTHEASGGRLIDLDISGGSYYGVKFDSDWDWDKSLPYDQRTGASDMLIENCIIHDTGADAVKITPGCDDVIIRNCEIYNSGQIINDNAEGIDNVNGDGMIVENCYIHDIATTGIYFKGGANGCVVKETTVERCGGGGIFAGFDTSTDWFDLDANPDYYEAIDSTIQNCIVRDTVYAGIALYASKDSRVYNNTIVDTAKEAHSPIYFGVTLQDWDPDAKRPGNINPVILNNIIYQNNVADTPMILIRFCDELGGLSALEGTATINNNCYYTSHGDIYFEDNRPGMEYYGDFDGWKSHINGDAFSIVQNPMLDDSWHLLTDSPCIDSGDRSVNIDIDIDGDKRTDSPDMGADEYIS